MADYSMDDEGWDKRKRVVNTFLEEHPELDRMATLVQWNLNEGDEHPENRKNSWLNITTVLCSLPAEYELTSYISRGRRVSISEQFSGHFEEKPWSDCLLNSWELKTAIIQKEKDVDSKYEVEEILRDIERLGVNELFSDGRIWALLGWMKYWDLSDGDVHSRMARYLGALPSDALLDDEDMFLFDKWLVEMQEWSDNDSAWPWRDDILEWIRLVRITSGI